MNYSQIVQEYIRPQLRAIRKCAAVAVIFAFMGLQVANAQTVSWNFEDGNDHGFTLFSSNPAAPAPNNSDVAGDESITGVGGSNGLPAAGVAWTIGPPDQFNGQIPAFEEGCHIVEEDTLREDGVLIPSGTLLYSNCNDPFGAVDGGDELIGPVDFTNERGQASYLNTYNLSQWGDDVHTGDNQQIARSPEVMLEENALLLAWVHGGGSGTHAPVADGDSYDANSSGIAVRAADGTFLNSVAATGANGTLTMLVLDLGDHAGETVYVDVVDAFSGGWGWLAVDEIAIAPFESEFDPNNFTFEAEDFNFDGGEYFDDPVICNDLGGADNCYFDRVGLQGIDKNEIDMSDTSGDFTEIYRYGSSFIEREELMDTRFTSDFLVRQQYKDAGIPEYELRLGEGEWVNYTRSFPAGAYNLFVRAPNGVPAGAETLARVDMVDNATVENQNLATLGWFLPPEGGGTGLYGGVPLTDASGTPIVVAFDDTPKTLRVTALADGYVANFYYLVATEDPVSSIPQVAITSPTEGETFNRGGQVTITATATAADGDAISGVEFFAGSDSIGEDVEGPDYSIAWTAAGANILNIRAVATTNSGVSAEVQVSVQLTGEDPNAAATGGDAIVWDFEDGNDHGFALSSLVPPVPTADDPNLAGDEALTGGLPAAGIAWTIGRPDQFDGQIPVVEEGCHVINGVLQYDLCNNPFGVVGDPPYDFTNGRGQSGYLSTYALNQWGDQLHAADNDQIATSRPVYLREGAKLTTWAFGNTGSRPAPEPDPSGTGYVSNTGGIAVRSAEDGSFLAGLQVAAQGGDGNMPGEFSLDLSDFAGQEVIFEVVDAFAGGWGWLVIDEIRIDNARPALPPNTVSWNFENGNDHGFALSSLVPPVPTADDPNLAGDEALTGGLPAAGIAWTIGRPDQFDGQIPVVNEGCHVIGGVLQYDPCNNPFGVEGDPPYDFKNGRGQSGYLSTYALNQWGDQLHTAENDQIATSRPVLLQEGAKLTTWAFGNTGSRPAPEIDPSGEGYVSNTGGIAVLSAEDGSFLTGLQVAAQGGDGNMPGEFSLDLSAFAGQRVVIEVVDAFAGGWGWLVVDEIRINNAIQTDVIWDFEDRKDHGFTLRSQVPPVPTADDPSLAGDEAWTGGLPAAGVAWTLGPPNRYDGRIPVVSEGCHVIDGVLQYDLCNNPFGVVGDPPFDFTNGRGQSGYLSTYALNQWGDQLHTAENDQIATSRPVMLLDDAVLKTWAFGNTGSRPAPEPDPGAGYVSNTGGIAVLSAADGSFLAGLQVAAEGGDGNMPAEFSLDLSAFAGQEVIIEVVDAFAGGWGWLVIDEIRINNALPVLPVAGPEINIGLNVDGDFVLTFEGVLLEAENVEGPYTEVVGATSPMTMAPDQARRFYRSQSSN